ncbi:hypothetical protein ACHQM5_025996 [Ranunculus cassubicifolius]
MAPSYFLSILSTFFIYLALVSFVPTDTKAEETGIPALVTEDLFKKVFPNIDSTLCPARGFYSYKAFINATKRFPEFGTTGCKETRKREIAAFFAQISHQSTSGNGNSTGPYTWGLCLKEEEDDELAGDYCDYSHDWRWDCSTMDTYKGRGPMMIRWNYNYGPAGKDLGLGYDLIWYPERLLNSSTLAFETALWVWMTERDSYPSPHNIMVGNYKPTTENLAANWTAGYGLTTNVIVMSTGGYPYECGQPDDGRVQNRIEYFKRIADLFKVRTGSNLDCANQEVMKSISHEFPPAQAPV